MSESDDRTTTLKVNWTKILVAFITATVTLIGTLGTVYLKHYLKPEKEDPIIQRLEKSAVLHSELERIQRKTEAARVTVAQFHNGSKFASGKQYEKISVTHQAVGQGVSSTENRISELPITLFEDVLLNVQKKDVVHYTNSSEIPNVGSIFREEGVTSLYIFKLEAVDSKYVGVMFLEYTRNQKELSRSTLKTIKEEARAIGSYLSSQNNRYNNG